MNHFTPYIFVATDREVSASYFSGLESKALREIHFQECEVRLLPDKLAEVAALSMRPHFTEHGGTVHIFGRITGYVLVETPNRYKKFSTHGEILEVCDGPFVDHLPTTSDSK
jgi:hypothetical protein